MAIGGYIKKEGEISESNLTKLKVELRRIIDYDQAFIIIYSFRTTKY